MTAQNTVQTSHTYQILFSACDMEQSSLAVLLGEAWSCTSNITRTPDFFFLLQPIMQVTARPSLYVCLVAYYYALPIHAFTNRSMHWTGSWRNTKKRSFRHPSLQKCDLVSYHSYRFNTRHCRCTCLYEIIAVNTWLISASWAFSRLVSQIPLRAAFCTPGAFCYEGGDMLASFQDQQVMVFL